MLQDNHWLFYLIVLTLLTFFVLGKKVKFVFVIGSEGAYDCLFCILALYYSEYRVDVAIIGAILVLDKLEFAPTDLLHNLGGGLRHVEVLTIPISVKVLCALIPKLFHSLK